MTGCDACLDPGAAYTVFDRAEIGVDETHGRFGDVRVDRCRTCDTVWLHYFIEGDGRGYGGRWFRGIIDVATAKSVTPETAVAVLQQLRWHIRGGTYFGGASRSTRTPLAVDG